MGESKRRRHADERALREYERTLLDGGEELANRVFNTVGHERASHMGDAILDAIEAAKPKNNHEVLAGFAFAFATHLIAQPGPLTSDTEMRVTFRSLAIAAFTEIVARVLEAEENEREELASNPVAGNA